MSADHTAHTGDEASAEFERVEIFDTTLRDGEQSPGISLNTQEKVEIANQLARLGVDVIEAGFPITSPGDFEAVQAIARTVDGPVVCGLARTQVGDIDAAWGAVKDSERPRIHTFISTSDIHIEHQLRTDREDVKGQAKAAVAHARSLCDDVEFSPMDATRAELEFTAEVCGIAIAEGAGVINIPDTVGYTTPAEYTAFLGRLYELLPELADVRLSVHCHDDLGLAVANSFAGVIAGARQVECAINGIGERAGNCALEEIVMLLRTRRGDHGFDTNLETTELARTSRMVSRFTGYVVQPNKAIIGRNAFAHESGIHQDGVLKERTTFEIMDARDVGFDSNQIVLGKHSGRHALKDALQQLGFVVEGNALNQAFKRFKALADKKKQVTSLDLEAIVSDEMRESSQKYELAWFEVEAGTEREPLAKVGVTTPAGEEVRGESGGDGPVDAVFGAIQEAVETRCELSQFLVSAVGEGDDALGEVTVMLRAHGRLASGQGVSTDIIEASAQAYVRALANALDGAAVREAESVAADAASAASPFLRAHRLTSMGALEGKVAAITGASSGIGEATALALVAEGAKVSLAARRKDRIDDLAERIASAGGTALPIETDVTDEAQANAFIQGTNDELGGPDILVNNAGVMLLGPVAGAPTEQWRRMIDVNLLGLLYCTHAALPIMGSAGSGDIVNVASVAGRIAAMGSGVYNMTKWGVVGFSEALRQECALAGVRVTAIEPGWVETELQGHNEHPLVVERMNALIESIDKILEPQDIARAITFAVTQPPHVSINEMLIRPTTSSR